MTSIGHESFNLKCLMLIVKLPNLSGTSLSLFDTQLSFKLRSYIISVRFKYLLLPFFQPASVLIFH